MLSLLYHRLRDYRHILTARPFSTSLSTTASLRVRPRAQALSLTPFLSLSRSLCLSITLKLSRSLSLTLVLLSLLFSRSLSLCLSWCYEDSSSIAGFGAVALGGLLGCWFRRSVVVGGGRWLSVVERLILYTTYYRLSRHFSMRSTQGDARS